MLTRRKANQNETKLKKSKVAVMLTRCKTNQNETKLKKTKQTRR